MTDLLHCPNCGTPLHAVWLGCPMCWTYLDDKPRPLSPILWSDIGTGPVIDDHIARKRIERAKKIRGGTEDPTPP